MIEFIAGMFVGGWVVLFVIACLVVNKNEEK